MSVNLKSALALSVSGVSKRFGQGPGTTQALEGVTFDVSDGEFFTIIGPSGCGKSTLLNLIAGLDEPNIGTIELGWVNGRQRLGQTAYMPQKDLLLPWRSVLDNSALGLELTGIPKREARRRASSHLERFGLAGFADAWPAELSGGMRQRAAFLRTVLTDKPVLLLDEPFGALDALTRRSMQAWLLDIWSELQRTVILITHDVEEAIFLSDRVAVMSERPGRILREFPVSLPRPRDLHTVTDPAFVELKRDMLDALHAGSSDDAE